MILDKMSEARPPDGAAAGRGAAPALDPVDRRILELLSTDGRMPIAGIAERVGISRAGAYARLDRLYLKQFLEERSRTTTLLLDASASLDWGDGAAHKGRYARQVAAALAWIGVSRHEPVRTYLPDFRVQDEAVGHVSRW